MEASRRRQLFRSLVSFHFILRIFWWHRISRRVRACRRSLLHTFPLSFIAYFFVWVVVSHFPASGWSLEPVSLGESPSTLIFGEIKPNEIQKLNFSPLSPPPSSLVHNHVDFMRKRYFNSSRMFLNWTNGRVEWNLSSRIFYDLQSKDERFNGNREYVAHFHYENVLFCFFLLVTSLVRYCCVHLKVLSHIFRMWWMTRQFNQLFGNTTEQQQQQSPYAVLYVGGVVPSQPDINK